MQSDAVLGTLGTYQPQPRTRAGAQTCALLQRMEEEPASYLETYQLGFLFSWHLAKGWSMGKRKEPEFTRRAGCWVRTQHTRIVRLLLSEHSINLVFGKSTICFTVVKITVHMQHWLYEVMKNTRKEEEKEHTMHGAVRS